MPSGFLGGGIGPMALKRRAAAAGWWAVAGQTCVAAYQPIGAASLAASYVNIANPGTYDAAPGVAPTLAADGWQFNGSTQYLTTGVVPTNNQQWSAIVKYADWDSSSQNGYVLGTYAGSTTTFGYYFGPSVLGYYNGNGKFQAGVPSTGAIIAIAGTNGYKNGVLAVSGIAALSGTFSQILIGKLGYIPTPISPWKGTIAAVAIYKPTEPSTTPMSAADVAALTTRMQALA